MKLLIGILFITWFGCGFVGAKRLDDVSFKTVLRGPITLAKALNEDPVTYPGPS
jgi:hypothetical protein